MSSVVSWVLDLFKAFNSPRGYLACAVLAVLYYIKKKREARFDKQYVVSLVPPRDYKILGKVINPPVDEIPTLVEEMRHSFLTGVSRPYAKRREQLLQLAKMLESHEEEFIAALKADLGRPRFEAIVYDIEVTTGEIHNMIKNLRKYMRPSGAAFDLLTFPSEDVVVPEPMGLALVIGTWNYPVMLALAPVAGAIAAGNTVILKPSNVSPNTADLLGRLIPKYMDPAIVSVVGPGIRGDRASIQALINERFDKIFFTGGPTVGRMVMAAASKHLTPVTLELGGKNPVFVADDADVALAAKRTIWGRMMNAGQQCIAPDYVLVHKRVADRFLAECTKTIKAFYEGDAKADGKVGRIVNDRHFQRLSTEVLAGHGGTVVCGGGSDAATRYIEPTVLHLPIDSPAMEEETFGPILMVVTVDNMDDAIRYVAGREKSLSQYIFSSSKAMQQRIVQNTSAGGVTINGTLFHVGHHDLPFGGVGRSGMGAYHGKNTFLAFSHPKPVLRKMWLPDGGALSDPFFIYPPWSDMKARLVRFLFRLM